MPKPIKGQNYHQWMAEQYGLKKVIERIWKVIGVASTGEDIKRTEEQDGRALRKEERISVRTEAFAWSR
jgi:hypothetical protein